MGMYRYVQLQSILDQSGICTICLMISDKKRGDIMGGWGSGSYLRWGSRRKAESSLPLDIRDFKRKGLLVPGGFITASWSRGGNVYSSIQGRVFVDQLLLMYQYNKSENIEQRIKFTWTDCNYGGKRVWFRCPNCGRRCAVIYYGGKYFACRKCCNILY